ncbi:MAG: hypothetical protein JNK97_16050 [Zoogloea sp.]|nr:hypothetical protein [Zoogloea sp.]
MRNYRKDKSSVAPELLSKTTYSAFDFTPFSDGYNPIAQVLSSLKKPFRKGKLSRAGFSRLDQHVKQHGKFIFNGPAPILKAQASRHIDGIWTLRVACCWCGEIHSHGGSNGPEPVGGHRLGHCFFADTPGYWLEIEEGSENA